MPRAATGRSHPVTMTSPPRDTEVSTIFGPGGRSSADVPQPSRHPARQSAATITATQRQRLAVAVHEAGHAVVGALHGATVTRLRVLSSVDREGRSGFCAYRPFNGPVGASWGRILAAGPLAEAVFRHGPQFSSGQLAAVLDAQHFDRDELRRLAFARGGPAVPRTELMPLLLRCWPSVAELATRLYTDGSATHQDVLDSLGCPSAALQSHYAASVRAGAVPGSFHIRPPSG